MLGVAATARAAPDGYTLVMAGSASLATTVTIYRKLPYDPTKDFAPLAFITRIPFVLVVNSVPASELGAGPDQAGQEGSGSTVLCLGCEPPRVCRRRFGLSHAAMAGFSSMA